MSTRGIPDLKLDLLAIHVDSSDFEVDTYSGNEWRCKLVFAEPQQETWFADPLREYQQLRKSQEEREGVPLSPISSNLMR